MELLNCPFCGAGVGDGYKSVKLTETRRSTTVYGLRVEPYTEYRVKCGNCGAEACCAQTGTMATGRTVTAEEARSFAVQSWNRRTVREIFEGANHGNKT